MAKRWQCTVCGYIHVGEEPPANCPVCGADRTQFVLLADPASARQPTPASSFRLHPPATHVPSGVLPTALLFLVLSLVFGISLLEEAAFWLVVTVTLATPAALGSGLYDRHRYFGGARAPIFTKKLILAALLLAFGLTATTVRYGSPQLLANGGWPCWLYLLCLAGMFGCVVLLGHYGGLLVFQPAVALSSAGREPAGSAADDWPARIVALAPDAILAADAAGIIRLWNHGAERTFGVPAGSALGQSLDLIIPEKLRQRHWEGWGKVMRSGVSRYGEAELLRVPALRGDGRRISVEFSIVMLKDADGRIDGIAAILRDASEQREREQRLQEELAACRAGQVAPPE